MEHPAILSLDAAMSGCSAGVLRPDGEKFLEILPMARGQSEQLVPLMERVMADSGLGYKDLSAVAVTIGPGAFTGIRIGLSAARALGVALNIPVTGIVTTEALARQYAARAEGPFAAVLETKRDDFYVQLFGQGGEALTEPEALTSMELAARLRRGMTVIGDASARLGFLNEVAVIDGFSLPDPRAMLDIARGQLASNARLSAEPLYLREADVSQTKIKIRRIEGENS